MGRVDETLKILRTASAKTDHILIAYSGGKDSLAVLDLCSRSFKRVSCFFMYFIPDLEVVEVMLDYARKRWGVEVLQYPHWITGKLIASGVYCSPSWRLDDLPKWTVRDSYDMALLDSGATLMATGARRSDSMGRRLTLSSALKHWTDVVYPIIGWKQADVKAYLAMQGIPLPSSSGASTSGIDLSLPSLLWLADQHPRDFARICEVFPYAEAVVWRRLWYGQTKP